MAHLFAGEVAYRDLDLDIVTFLPAGMPWQKADRSISTAGHRWEMTRLAVDDVSYFEADDREVLREGWTYTVDTLAEFGDDDLVLILGADAAARIPTWRRPDEVLKLATVAVVPRPGTTESAVVEALPGGFHWLGGPELDISGTMLRSRLAEGRSVRFLVPDAVAAYIDEHGLYAPEGDPPSL